MALHKEKLTQRLVENLTANRPQSDVWDEPTTRAGVLGLFVRVSGATGRKTWMFRYRAGGRMRKMKIGTFPAMSVAEARTEALRLRAEADKGVDPLEERKAAEKRPADHTFRAMAEEIMGNPPRRKLRESTRTEWRRILEAELLPRWGEREAGSIERREIVLALDEIARRAPSMAANVHSLIRWLFRGALRRDFPGLEADPASQIANPNRSPGRRERFLTVDEIRSLWTMTGAETLGTKLGFRLGLLTGQRFGNVHQLRFSDVEVMSVRDFGGAVWKIPSEHFKGRREHWVPLSPPALQVVEDLRQHRSDDVWAFPSRKGAAHPYLTRWSNGQRRLRAAMGTEWTAHDLRRTFRVHSTQALGIDPRIADAVLGHADHTVGARHYAGSTPDVDLEAKAAALEKYGAWIEQLVGERNE
jgi:integrase